MRLQPTTTKLQQGATDRTTDRTIGLYRFEICTGCYNGTKAILPATLKVRAPIHSTRCFCLLYHHVEQYSILQAMQCRMPYNAIEHIHAHTCTYTHIQSCTCACRQIWILVYTRRQICTMYIRIHAQIIFVYLPQYEHVDFYVSIFIDLSISMFAYTHIHIYIQVACCQYGYAAMCYLPWIFLQKLLFACCTMGCKTLLLVSTQR